MKPGDHLDRYTIEARLGQGGMGEVFEALDSRLGRRVALKVLPQGHDATATQRLLREARAAAAFQHPNAVVVYDVGETEGESYIAMELVRGKPMRAFVGDPLVPLGRRVRWLVDAARALGAAHRAGLIHRDVKPDNVMIADDGAVKVLDFGIARRNASDVDPSAPTAADVLPTLTGAGVVVGTPLYASPEQLRNEALDGRSDQFSWGVTAYELLSGFVPWRTTGDAVALISQILSADPTPLAERAPGVPAEVVTAVARAMSKAATARFESMADAADALDPFAEAPASTLRTPAVARTGEAHTLASGSATPGGRLSRAAPLARKTGRALLIGLAGFGGLVFAGLVVAGTTGHLVIDAGRGHDAGAADAASAEAGRVVIPALACSPATATGEGATDQMKAAIGVGACARLAVAIGVEWEKGSGSPLTVEVKLAKDKAEVTLSVAGVKRTGVGPTPLAAIQAAVDALAPALTSKPLTAAQIKAWGADDEAGARRIEATWRALVLNTLPDPMVAARALVKSDPGSPWSHAILALAGRPGEAATGPAITKALELSAKLEPARARGLSALMRFYGRGGEDTDALQELRKTYGETPDDAEIASLYAAVAVATRADEGFAVVDRLIARFPTRSILAIHNALEAASDRDAERDARYRAKMTEILPETAAWPPLAHDFAGRGKIAEAKAALAFGDAFGLYADSAKAAAIAATRGFVALAALEPREALAFVKPHLADPREHVVSELTNIVVDAHFLEGALDDALEAQRRQVERGRTLGAPFVFGNHAINYALALHRLGRGAPPVELLDAAAKAIAGADFLPELERAKFAGYFALVRASDDPKKAKIELAPALAAAEAAADTAPDRTVRDSVRIHTLALVRIVRGDAAAVALWRSADHADRWARDEVTLDAAFALERTGADAEAAAAYAIIAGPREHMSSLERMIATLRLGALEKKMGKEADAAAHEATVARLWSKVDAATIARISKL